MLSDDLRSLAQWLESRGERGESIPPEEVRAVVRCLADMAEQAGALEARGLGDAGETGADFRRALGLPGRRPESNVVCLSVFRADREPPDA